MYTKLFSSIFWLLPYERSSCTTRRAEMSFSTEPRERFSCNIFCLRVFFQFFLFMLFVLLYGAGIIARWSRRALSDETDESENAFFTPCEAKMISKLTGDATAWKWAALCKSLGISFTFEIYFIECFKFCYRTKNFKFTYELTASWKFWSGTVLRQNSWTYQLTVFLNWL